MTTKINLFGDVGRGELTARSVSRQLRNTEVTLRIDSDGGSAFEGLSIYNVLKSSGSKITAYVDGVAASAASIILMAADHIICFEASTIMIHEASTTQGGTASELAKEIELLNRLNDQYANIYAQRTGKSFSTVRGWMRAETTWSGAEAVKAGFGDELVTFDAGRAARSAPAAVYRIAAHARPAQIAAARAAAMRAAIAHPAGAPRLATPQERQEWVNSRVERATR